MTNKLLVMLMGQFNNYQLIFLYKNHVIFSDYMRANQLEHCQSSKNTKISRVRTGHSSSGDSLKRVKSKNNNSNQKHNIQTGPKNVKVQDKEREGRLQYFNKEVNPVSKKVACNKNDQYCPNYVARNKSPHQQKDKASQTAFNKLKLQTARGAINFDGKIVTVEAVGQARKTNESRSIEQFTQIIQKSQTSKLNIKKPKSKSQPKKSRNKSNKNKQKQKQKQKTKQTNNIVLKQISHPKMPYCLNKVETNGTSQQTQVSFQVSKIQNFDIDQLREEINLNKERPFQLNYLKKVSKGIRSEWLIFMSKFCYEMQLNKDVFFLAAQLVDRYLNQQILLNKHKMLALSSLLLCLKLDDTYKSKMLNYEIFNPDKRKTDIHNTENTVKKQKKNKKQGQKKNEQDIANINKILKMLDKTINQQFKMDPTADQLLQFQTLILIKEQFRIRKNDLSFWIDAITLAWDRHIMQNLSNSPLTRKMLFRLSDKPENYFFLVQIIQFSLQSVQIYMHSLPIVVLSTILLMCKTNMEDQSNSIFPCFSETKANIQKSHNWLLRDKLGEVNLFLLFLQQIDVEMGDILSCCKYVSQYLNSDWLEYINADKAKQINRNIERIYLHRHFYNPKIKYAAPR